MNDIKDSKVLSINSKMLSSDDFITEVEKSFKKIIDYGRAKCCVCHHDLDDHIDEGDFWRCHALGLDHYQCECILSKHKAKNDINFYDLALRAEEQIEELRQSNDIIEKL